MMSMLASLRRLRLAVRISAAAEKHLQELYVRYITSYTEELVAKTTGRSALTIAELTGLAKLVSLSAPRV